MGSLNQNLFNAIYGLSHKSFFLDGIGAFLANYFPYFLAIGAIIVLVRVADWRFKVLNIIEAGLAALLARGIITELIRHFYVHPRPFAFYNFTPLIPESGNSFPSGHMTLFFALSTTIFLINKKWGWVFMFSSLVIGVARIYCGVHWPLDILGGAVIGILSALLIRYFVRPYRNKMLAPEIAPAEQV